MTKTVVSLNDKYTQDGGQVMLSALQGVVRLLLDQARRDAAAGLTSGGFVSGYRGSPITTLDAQLWAAEKLLTQHDIRFEPGLNEELAATSLRGTQQLGWYGKPRVDGVFSLWYAKGVGVERAGEAIKAANFEGTHPQGGALLLCGDDHAAKSSLTAHQSEHVMMTAMVPMLYPATTDEILRFGQLGWAMSRATGLYVAMKAVTDTLDLTATVTLPGHDFPIVLPDAPAQSPNLRIGMSALEQEAAVIERRLPLVPGFTALNAIDRVSHDGSDRRLTVVTAGKSWLDVCQALADLGLDAGACRALGLRVVKLGLVWPVDVGFIREACGGSAEVLVIEEKRSVIEDQLARAFYGRANAPALSGKTAPDGTPLLSEIGVLDPGSVRRALVSRLVALGLMGEDLRACDAALRALEAGAEGLSRTAIRPAFFCSGCPHNTSTLVPDGSAAMGATGCHGLAHFMPERNTMQTVSMGQEGMPWVAAQTFVDTPHMFQNLGDGTYTHSGLLAIRASVAAKSSVTYKILYNDAVAMTGGTLAKRTFDDAALAAKAAKLPVPAVRDISERPLALLVTGIGGTGVLTVGAILAMAAHLEGKAAKVLDQTGMAQKGGAVTSHLRIGRDTGAIPSARLGTGQADVVIACDLIVGSSPDVLALTRPDTRVLANEDVVPTGEFQTNRNLDLTASRFLTAIGKRVGRENIFALRAGALAARLLGDTIFTNLMMVGFAAQQGLLPVALDSIEAAIRLNGVAVKANLSALSLGRLAAHSAEDLFDLAETSIHEAPFPRSLADITASRAKLLTAWQNESYAREYIAFLDEAAATLSARGLGACDALMAEIARGLGKLMAYKDEYEVARLYSDPAFMASLTAQFAGQPKLSVHLAPPLLPLGKDAKTGRPRKIAFGGWVFPVFRLLAKAKRLRGTPLDLFGYSAERRMERALIGEYRDLVRRIAGTVTAAAMPAAIELAAAPDLIAGYGPVKDGGVAAFRAQVAQLLPKLSQAATPPMVAREIA